MHARRVLCNDDGWILSAHEGAFQLTVSKVVGPAWRSLCVLPSA